MKLLFVLDERARNERDALARWNGELGFDGEGDPFTGEIYTVGDSVVAREVTEESYGDFHSSSVVVVVRTGTRITSLLYATNAASVGISPDQAVEGALAQNAVRATLNRPLPLAVTDAQQFACFFGSDVEIGPGSLSDKPYASLTRSQKKRLVGQFNRDWEHEYSASFVTDRRRRSLVILKVRSRKTHRAACVAAPMQSRDRFHGARCP